MLLEEYVVHFEEAFLKYDFSKVFGKVISKILVMHNDRCIGTAYAYEKWNIFWCIILKASALICNEFQCFLIWMLCTLLRTYANSFCLKAYAYTDVWLVWMNGFKPTFSMAREYNCGLIYQNLIGWWQADANTMKCQITLLQKLGDKVPLFINVFLVLCMSCILNSIHCVFVLQIWRCPAGRWGRSIRTNMAYTQEQ